MTMVEGGRTDGRTEGAVLLTRPRSPFAAGGAVIVRGLFEVVIAIEARKNGYEDE